jgi:hypothetical protein
VVPERHAGPTSGQPARPSDEPHLLGAGAEGLITGTVVCAAVIAYGAGHVDSILQLDVAILGTVAVYWLAHLHAATLASSLAHRHHPLLAFRHAARETWPIAAASVLPVGVLVLAELLGADLRVAAWSALIATIGLLTIYSYLAGARSGLDRWGRIASACAGAAIGILVALLKVALH